MFKVAVVENNADSPFVLAGSKLMVSMEPWISLEVGLEMAIKLLSDKTKSLYVAALGEELQGIMLLDLTGPFKSYIHILCVAVQWQGKGLAKQFIDLAEHAAFKISPNLFICVSDFNPRAKKLYESLGFVQCGLLKDYIIRGKDEILLRKTIGSRVEFAKGLLHYP
jgi:ribosomal-protein-alanine N-acetyltransferase